MIAILRSILDNDLYKFSMSYAYMKLYPEAEGTFEFKDRNNLTFEDCFLVKLKEQFKQMESLSMTDDEFAWAIKAMPYIPQCYWEWFKGFRYDASTVNAWLDEDKHLHITVTGKLYKVTFYEVPILAIVSELVNIETLGKAGEKERKLWNPNSMNDVLNTAMPRLAAKVKFANENNLCFSEFGTRRRFSFEVQDMVVGYIKNTSKTCSGTSNVYLAYKYDMKPIGTVAHEWIMFHGANFGYRMANYEAFEAWVNAYDGDLGIALTDTYGSKLFFKNFSMKQAKLFDGVRQDSGDEIEFAEDAIKRYKELGIDPMTKTIIFSNALDFEKYEKIASWCKGKVKCAAGIGTNLTNDTGYKPMNIVMKLVKCRMNNKQNWTPCIKISDDLGKHMGDSHEIDTCLKIIESL